MTTAWKPAAEWKGATVAVLAAGPSLTPETIMVLREQADRVIAVNDVCAAAPWADMLVALDGNWPQPYLDFAGMQVTGVADPDLNALYVGPRWESITISPGHVIEIRNSGLAAVRIAGELGAARILLAGFDPDLWPAKSEMLPSPPSAQYVGLAAGLAVLVAELEAAGVEVERWIPEADDEADES